MEAGPPHGGFVRLDHDGSGDVLVEPLNVGSRRGSRRSRSPCQKRGWLVPCMLAGAALGALGLVLVIIGGRSRKGDGGDGSDPGRLLDDLFQEYWEAEADDNPDAAMYFGVPDTKNRGWAARWPTITEEAFAAQQRRRSEQLHRARALLERLTETRGADEASLHPVERERFISARTLIYLLQFRTELYWHRPFTMPVTHMAGPQTDMTQVVSILSFVTAQDYENYLARLADMPRFLQQTADIMRVGLREQRTPPRSVLDPVGAQIRSLVVDAGSDVALRTSPFYKPFVTIAPTAAADAAAGDRLRGRGLAALREHVMPALSAFQRFWEQEYLPRCRETIGLSALPNGTRYYELMVAFQTTTTATPQQLFETGLREVDRIGVAMARAKNDTGFAGNMTAFVHMLRTDPRFYFTDEEALLAHVRNLCKRVDPSLPQLFGRLPRCPFGVRPIPETQAPAAPAAYYFQPSNGCSRAGIFHVNTYMLDQRPSYLMETLSLHEAQPGHHLQMAIAQELEGLPAFRTFAEWTAYIEGWALYSESLGERMGFFTDPYNRFGKHGFDMMRACRLVVDTGMHLMGWSRERAVQYVLANTPLSESDVRKEVDRYLVLPAQALAYKAGELRILALRSEAEGSLGAAFDIRAFHDTLLGSGALPLRELDLLVRQWIQRRKQGVQGVEQRSS